MESISSTQWFMFGVLVFFALARIIELFVSKGTADKAKERGEKAQKEPIFLVMVIVHVSLFALVPLEVFFFDRSFYAPMAIAMLVILTVALVARVWTLRTLGKRWNVRIVQPDAVVHAGPYKYIRHPNYAVVITELFAIPLVHNAYLSCLFLTIANGVVLYFRIRSEEKVLFEVPQYKELMASKPRFFPSWR